MDNGTKNETPNEDFTEWDETLTDPDAGDVSSVSTFRYGEEMQEFFLGAILTQPDILAHGLAMGMTAKTFGLKFRPLSTIAVNYYDRHGTCPPLTIIDLELRKKYDLSDEKGRNSYALQKALLAKALDVFQPGLDTKEWVKDNLATYAKNEATRRAYKKYLEAEINNTDVDEAWAEYKAEMERIHSLTVANETLVHLNAKEFFELAEANPLEWLLDGWIAARHFHLLAGSKKIGKSTLVHSMMAALLTGKDWHNKIVCKPSSVLYLDWENDRSYIATNLLANLPREDWEAVGNNLDIPKQLPTILTGEWLKTYMVGGGLDKKQGTIFIDSAFPAFAGLFVGSKRVWENTASDVRMALKPITEVAREFGWAVVLIHHDNKQGDTGGSAQWEAGVDFVFHYEVKGNARQLTPKWGRWNGPKPDALLFSMDGYKLVLDGKAKVVAAKEKEAKTAEQLDPILAAVPVLEMGQTPSPDNTMSTTDLCKALGLKKQTTFDRTKLLVAEGRLQRQRFGHNQNDPYHWWRYDCL